MSAEQPTLIGPRIMLRPAIPADLDALRRLPLDPDAARMFGVTLDAPHPRTEAMAQKACKELTETPHLWVIDAGAGYIGHIKLHRLNLTDQRAMLAIWIEDPALRGQGRGTEAVALVMKHAFATLNLHRVGIRVLAINARALRCYQACGFVIEGRERETAQLDGVWLDDLMLGCLEHEFIASRGASALNGSGSDT